MRWLVLTIVLASLRADARPPPRDRFDDDIHDPFEDRFVPRKLRKKRPPPPPPCKPTASFKKFMGCHFKDWDIDILRDMPAAKFITMTSTNASYGRKQLALYVLVDKSWVRAGVYAELNDSTELLRFEQLGSAYRVDLGFANTSWVTVDELTTRPAILKRTFTYVCEQNAACRSVQSSCDVLVHGRSVASFRGTVRWDGKDLKVRGDDRNTNRYCAKPPAGVMETD